MSRLTKLQAVNLVLSAAGLYPVNTIDGPTNMDASLVVALLEAVHRETLAQGWHFNTEYEVSLEVESMTGTIPVPSTILRCEIPDMPWVIMRGTKLYDRNAKTDVFEEAVMAKVIKYLEWDELPEEIKELIYKMASVRFYLNHKGSDDNLRLLTQDAAIARAAAVEMDSDVGNFSIFDDPSTALGVPPGHMYMPGAPRGGQDPMFNRTPE